MGDQIGQDAKGKVGVRVDHPHAASSVHDLLQGNGVGEHALTRPRAAKHRRMKAFGRRWDRHMLPGDNVRAQNQRVYGSTPLTRLI